MFVAKKWNPFVLPSEEEWLFDENHSLLLMSSLRWRWQKLFSAMVIEIKQFNFQFFRKNCNNYGTQCCCANSNLWKKKCFFWLNLLCCAVMCVHMADTLRTQQYKAVTSENKFSISHCRFFHIGYTVLFRSCHWMRSMKTMCAIFKINSMRNFYFNLIYNQLSIGMAVWCRCDERNSGNQHADINEFIEYSLLKQTIFLDFLLHFSEMTWSSTFHLPRWLISFLFCVIQTIQCVNCLNCESSWMHIPMEYTCVVVTFRYFLSLRISLHLNGLLCVHLFVHFCVN